MTDLLLFDNFQIYLIHIKLNKFKFQDDSMFYSVNT